MHVSTYTVELTLYVHPHEEYFRICYLTFMSQQLLAIICFLFTAPFDRIWSNPGKRN